MLQNLEYIHNHIGGVERSNMKRIFLFILIVTSITYAEPPYIVKDINTNANSTSYSPEWAFLLSDNKVVFYYQGISETALMVSRNDGSSPEILYSSSTNPIRNSYGTDGSTVAANSNFVFFVVTAGTAQQLWRTDGTVGGTIMLTEQGVINGVKAIGSKVYFRTRTPNAAWVTDGSVSGTIQLRAMSTHSNSYVYSPVFVEHNGEVFFGGQDPSLSNRATLFKTDGTVAGTVIHHQFATGITREPNYLFSDGNYLYMSCQLTTSGSFARRQPCYTTSSTPVSGIKPISSSLDSESFYYGGISINGTVYFQSRGLNAGMLFKSDRTDAGSLELQDFAPSNSDGGYPRGFAKVGSKIILLADPGANDVDFLIFSSSDGNSFEQVLAGNNSFHDVLSRYATSSTSGNRIFYVNNQRRLVYTDGSTSNLVPDLLSLGVGNSRVERLPTYNGKLLALESNQAFPKFILLDLDTLQRTPLGFAPVVGSAGSSPTMQGSAGGDRCMFSTEMDDDTWGTDGTAFGTRKLFSPVTVGQMQVLSTDKMAIQVKDIITNGENFVSVSRNHPGTSTLREFRRFRGKLSGYLSKEQHTGAAFFEVEDTRTNQTLIVRTDGTQVGTFVERYGDTPNDARFRLVFSKTRGSLTFQSVFISSDSNPSISGYYLSRFENGVFRSKVKVGSPLGTSPVAPPLGETGDVSAAGYATIYRISPNQGTEAWLILWDGVSVPKYVRLDDLPGGYARLLGVSGTTVYVQNLFNETRTVWGISPSGSRTQLITVPSSSYESLGFGSTDSFALIAIDTDLYRVQGSSANLLASYCQLNLNFHGKSGVSNEIYFGADGCTDGMELHKFNGTSVVQVDNIHPNDDSLDYSSMYQCGGTVYFAAQEPNFGLEPWAIKAQDLCPSDSNKTAPGICGCGVSDIDSDSNGNVDCRNSESIVEPILQNIWGGNGGNNGGGNNGGGTTLNAPTGITTKFNAKNRTLTASLPQQSDVRYVFEYKVTKAGKKPPKKFKRKIVSRPSFAIKKLAVGDSVIIRGAYSNEVITSSFTKQRRVRIRK